MKVEFYRIFKYGIDGSLEALNDTRISSITLSKGAKIKNIMINGINLNDYIGRYLQIKKDNDILVVTGIY